MNEAQAARLRDLLDPLLTATTRMTVVSDKFTNRLRLAAISMRHIAEAPDGPPRRESLIAARDGLRILSDMCAEMGETTLSMGQSVVAVMDVLLEPNEQEKPDEPPAPPVLP